MELTKEILVSVLEMLEIEMNEKDIDNLFYVMHEKLKGYDLYDLRIRKGIKRNKKTILKQAAVDKNEGIVFLFVDKIGGMQ